MTSVFDSLQPMRADAAGPVTLTPQAAKDGLPDDPDTGAGLDLSFFLSLGASLGSLADGMQADRDRRDRQQAPGDDVLISQGTIPASGILILDMGSVPLGRVWQVRRLIAGGFAVNTAAAGSVAVFAQGAPPTDLNLASCVDLFTTLPKGNTYGTHQLFLLEGSHLFVAFYSATPGQQYVASARVESWDAQTWAETSFTE